MDEIMLGGYGEVVLKWKSVNSIGGDRLVVTQRDQRVVLDYQAITAIAAIAKGLGFSVTDNQAYLLAEKIIDGVKENRAAIAAAKGAE